MILYFGNILSSKGNNPSFIEILGPRLAALTDVKLASNKASPVIRLAHMALVFVRYMRKSRIILIDTYSYKGFYYALMIAWMSKWTGKRYIPIVHGGDFKRRLTLSPGLTRFLLGNAFAIVAPSPYMERLISEHGFKVIYIPNFINKEQYPFKERSSLKPAVLWVRSFHTIYNPSLALLVLRELVKTFPDARLGMVGPDKDDTGIECRKLAVEWEINDKVVFAGKLTKAEWFLFSRSYDIFINTTNIDNQPVSVIEAMLLGLPVVSTNVGGLPDLLKEGREGLLVEPNNVDAFVKSIQRLLSDPLIAREIQHNARAKAETYDWSEVKTKWIDLLSI